MDSIKIPYQVLRDHRLQPLSKMLYGELKLRPRRHIWVNHKELSSLYGVSQSEIMQCLNELIKYGYIYEVDGEQKKLEIIKLSCLNIKGILECEWCNSMELTLEEHHYPIPASLGGTDTVYICPNCHSAYHHAILVRFKE